MPVGITEDHESLRRSARRWLTDRCPPAVPRALLDSDDEPRPEFWAELAGLGWFGLHLPEEYGGAGGTLLDLAVVVEETGRACLPGPFLPTIGAAAAIAAATDEAIKKELLPGLADGTSIGALALGEGVTAERTDDGLVLHGETRPVVGAALADRIVLHAHVDGVEQWFVVDSSACQVTPLPSLDRTRRVAAVGVEGVVVPPSRLLPGVTGQTLDPIVQTLISAEAVGGAGWCLDTAVEYAKVREQFGRPIGQFQAVKHRCADLLIGVEQAAGATWDAASAAEGDEGLLAAAVALQLAVETYFRAAKDCVQILGGIGFTWEHDAHLYLKRAMTLRGLVGGPSPWRERVAALALAGARRHLDLALPDSVEPFRAEVRAYLATLQELDETARLRDMADGGWLAPHWPKPWGREATAEQQLVIDEEFRRAKVRRPGLQIAAWVLPTLIEHGSLEQQQRWIPPTQRGEITWCQLFSEPGAGSDLAALSTRAERVAGGWSVTGQKVWTSLAQQADHGILLARTNPTAPKHAGITYFLVDMKTPGIDIRPLRELTGHAMFNEVFFTDVFVPDEGVVGEVDGGWRLARTTLANERVAMGSGSSFGGGLEIVLNEVAARPAVDDPIVRGELGALLAEAESLAVLGFRTTLRALSGSDPGAASSVRKLLGVEHEQRVTEFSLSLLGPEAATTEGSAGTWTFGFLANRCLTIAGGTSEVQRNVIAERLLGLPRDPEPGS